MDYRQIEVIRKRGYYIELCYFDGKFWVEVDRGEDILEHDYFNTEDEAYERLETLYFDYIGEIYLRD